MLSVNHEIMKMSSLRYRTTLEKFKNKWNSSSSAQVGSFQRTAQGPVSFRSTRWNINYAGSSTFGRRRNSSKSSPYARQTP